ncbi:MAG TPA: ATP-binding protein [Verrucomicrobiae bacterium]
MTHPPSAKVAALRRRAEAELMEFGASPESRPKMAGLYRRAEARLRKRRRGQGSKAGVPKSAADPRRLLHELQVHQVELEMQNAELQEARDRMEVLLEKYTDLYDFAPVSYFSLDEAGRILEVNLTGAASLGVERSRLINQPLPRFVAPASQPIFRAFLERVFAGAGKQVCEAALLKKGAAAFWASFHATSAISLSGPRKWCRLAVSDITSLKQAEEAQRRMEALTVANQELEQEIARRQAVEEALRKSEQHYSRLLTQSRHMQQQLRLLSRQLLLAQEEERKKISRELHDVIAQTLTGINVRLANLKSDAASNTRGLERHIARTQQLVERSVKIVHRFARELRPAVLDDLGLIPALHTFMKHFRAQTGIRVSLSAFSAVEKVGDDKRTVLYRVAQEALTNIARHSQASQAEVKVRKLDAAISMEIRDNGKGFQQDRVLHEKKKNRLGLLGMRERVEMVNGEFSVTSSPGKGTTILVRIPLIDRAPGRGAAALTGSAGTKL